MIWFKKNWQFIVSISFIGLVIFISSLSYYIYKLNQEMQSALAKKRFVPVVEFYAQATSFYLGEKLNLQEFYEDYETSYPSKDYSLSTATTCEQLSGIDYFEIDSCLRVYLPHTAKTPGNFLIGLSNKIITYIYDLEEERQVNVISFSPLLFAQYYNNKPILRREIDLGDSPPLCLNAILSIEDNEFLEHSGFNFKSILRAVIKNLKEGRKAQGGSTITQQLVKNYFLSHEKTFQRKFKELFMAILLETKFHKDEILQAYINEIYMGQNATFEVRGFAAASEHYFRKNIEDLNLSECSLLAAIINSPGRYNPFTRPENAKSRRDLVLSKMLENKIIDTTEYQAAINQDLPKVNQRKLDSPAPYFMDAAMLQVKELGIDPSIGLKVFTTMQLRAQQAASDAVRYGLDRIHSNYKKLLPEKSEDLQGILISANPSNGYVIAVVGGKDYRLYPYNRAVLSHRQIGSTMKPFIYLTALNSFDGEGNVYSPLTILDDSPFKYEYEGQIWQPKNYRSKYFGTIPMFFALKNSLNVSTAKLAIDVGLDSVIDVARSLGIRSPMEPVPALSLGAFELYPHELLEAYTTLARFGSHIKLTFVSQVTNLEGDIVYEHQISASQVQDKENVAILISMMKQTIANGTGQLARILGLKHPAAGKTGTTSESKDSWFAGFSPYLVSVAWVGFDDNRSHNLTGASGALPIWTDFMKKYGARYPTVDFNWPEELKAKRFSIYDLEDLGISAEDADKMGEIELYLAD